MNPHREEEIVRILAKLRVAWLSFPEQRLCQLVWNVANNTGTMQTRDCFRVSDTAFELELPNWMKTEGDAAK